MTSLPTKGHRVLVSACVITYNQEAYVAQALDSILAQQGDFDLEVVISDDCSTDGTAEIIEEYRDRFPDVFSFRRRSRNVGFMQNFFDNLASSRGEYIALLDGDDYWTEENKIAKQLAVLEADPGLQGVFHDCWIEDARTGQRRLRIGERRIDETVDIHSLVLEKNVFTASMFFRNFPDWSTLPEWVLEAPMGDYLLAILVARRGPWQYIPGVMALYRSHLGVWEKMSAERQLEKQFFFMDLLARRWPDRSLAKTIATKQRMLWRKRAIRCARSGERWRSVRFFLRSGFSLWRGRRGVSLSRYAAALRAGTRLGVDE